MSVKNRIVLIGCGKAKAETPEPVAARDLYTGNLFRARLNYVDVGGYEGWYILSAKAGLVKPDAQMRAYDVAAKSQTEVARAAWAVGVVAQLLDELPDLARLREVSVEIHAGADYAELLRDVLRSLGCSVSWPVEGMGIGEQLAWYPEAADCARLNQPLPARASKAAS